MRKLDRLWLALLLALLFGSYPAAAQDVMQLAKKEGKVVWYSSASLSLSQKLCESFNAKKLGVECVLHRDGSGELFTRLQQEAKAGIHNADVLHTSSIGHFVSLRKAKGLTPYRPKGIEKFDQNFIEKNGQWAVVRASVYGPAFNTTKVKESEAPKSWRDFLDPKWRDRKLVNAHPSYSAFVSVGMSALVKLFGWEFFDKLAAQKPIIVQSALDTVVYVVRGEAWMSVGGTAYTSAVAIQKGEPIKHAFPKEGVPLIVSPQAILAKAPHPNAAKVFVDWLFSKEAQQVMVEDGTYVGHPEVEYPKWQTPLKDIKLLVIPEEEAEEMRKPVLDNFRAKFGV
ncbi:MAG TPA: extracellular solute-binding protein [Candidatus Binatia bacterium]|nr:extracellular solute-binding protein [Candidatus Binatia bacterium]